MHKFHTVHGSLKYKSAHITLHSWNTKVEKGPLFKNHRTMAQVSGGKPSHKAHDKRTSRCLTIRLSVAPHWVEILWEQGVKTNTWTQRQDTWHFKVFQLYRPSSSRPVRHGVSLTPIMKPKSNCFPGHSFLLHLLSISRPPAEEHMSPITVLLSQHTIKAARQSLLLGSIPLWSLLLHMFKSPTIKSNLKQQCLNLQLFIFLVYLPKIHDTVLTA